MRLAVFDVDGTLVDSQHNIVAAMNSAALGAGFPIPPPEAVRRIIGLSILEAVGVLFPDAEPGMQARIADSYKSAFFTMRTGKGFQEMLFPGALDALAALERDGWLLGLATGKTRTGVEAMLVRHGLVGRFVTIQTADENPGKPHPAMLRNAVAEAGVVAAEAVMVGDTAFDMAMAKAAGVGGIGVAWGYHETEEMIEAGAKTVITSFAELPAWAVTLTQKPPCVSA